MTFIQVLKNNDITGIKFKSKKEFDERKQDYENFVSDMESYILEKMNKEDFMQKYNLDDREMNDLFITNNKLNNLFFIRLHPYKIDPISDLQTIGEIKFPSEFSFTINKNEEDTRRKAKIHLPDKFENDNNDKKEGKMVIFKENSKTGEIEQLSSSEIPDLLKEVMGSIKDKDTDISLRRIELSDKEKDEIIQNIFGEKLLDLDKNLEKTAKELEDYINYCKEKNIEIDQKKIDSMFNSIKDEDKQIAKSIFEIIDKSVENTVDNMVHNMSEEFGREKTLEIMESLYGDSLNILSNIIDDIENKMEDASDEELSKYLDKDLSFILKFLSDFTVDTILNQDISNKEKLKLLIEISREKIKIMKSEGEK